MQDLKQKLPQALKHKDGSATAVIVQDSQKEFLAYGQGEADKDSLYEIGSITKVFTALLLLILESKDKLNRNDHVRNFLDLDFSDPKVADIKLWQLAAHSSGLPRLPENWDPADPKDPYADYTKDDLYDFLANCQLDETRGEFAYSNLGYGLLGHLLELVDGRNYADMLQQEIFQPLGMKSSFIDIPENQRHRLQTGHNAEGEAAPRWHLGLFAGAGGVVSSSYDMSLFLQDQLDPETSKLEPASVNARESLAESKQGKLQHGFGWVMGTSKYGYDFLGHNGQTGGYQSFLGLSRKRQAGLVVLASCKLDLDGICGRYFGVV